MGAFGRAAESSFFCAAGLAIAGVLGRGGIVGDLNRMSGLIELFDVDIYFCLICRKISVSVRNIGMKAFWVGMMDLNRFI